MITGAHTHTWQHWHSFSDCSINTSCSCLLCHLAPFHLHLNIPLRQNGDVTEDGCTFADSASSNFRQRPKNRQKAVSTS